MPNPVARHTPEILMFRQSEPLLGDIYAKNFGERTEVDYWSSKTDGSEANAGFDSLGMRLLKSQAHHFRLLGSWKMLGKTLLPSVF
jgi:hypothetical protein